MIVSFPTSSMSAVVWSGFTFALGIACKSVIDTYVQRREAVRKFAVEKRTAFLEQQLSRFYWPLYLHLQKDSLLQELRMERDQDPGSPKSILSVYIESSDMLPNHKRATEVIETCLHLAGTVEVVNAAHQYARHVMLYEMLRAAGLEKEEPVSHGQGYPSNFFQLIEQRARTLQDEYDSLIR